jgi:2,5-diketo-D-gluconate reductase A
MVMVPVVRIADGVDMPVIGLGTSHMRGTQVYDAISCALEAGYRLIDTATMYGNQTEVGRAIRDSGLGRGAVFITTKLPGVRAGQERQVLTESLQALDTDYVDLWLVHWPPRGLGASERVWRELLLLRSEGLCRAVGVSNYSPAQIDELIVATGESPAVNQVRWSPSGHDPDLLTALRQRGITVEGFGPLKGTQLQDPVLCGIAAGHGVTPAQVALRWHIQLGIIVIPKSANQQRIQSNIDLFAFSLTPDEMDRVSELPAP